MFLFVWILTLLGGISSRREDDADDGEDDDNDDDSGDDSDGDDDCGGSGRERERERERERVERVFKSARSIFSNLRAPLGVEEQIDFYR